MIGATDYVGIGTLVAAIGAAIVSIIVALRQPIIGAQVKDVREQVGTTNGHTIGQLIEGNEARKIAAGEPSTDDLMP